MNYIGLMFVVNARSKTNDIAHLVKHPTRQSSHSHPSVDPFIPSIHQSIKVEMKDE